MTSFADRITMRIFALTIMAMLGVSSAGATEATSYLSALNYRKYNCEELAEEALATATRVGGLTHIQTNLRAGRENPAAPGTVVIQWPDLSSRNGKDDDPTLTKIKDQILVLEQAIIEKQCSIIFNALPAQPNPQTLHLRTR